MCIFTSYEPPELFWRIKKRLKLQISKIEQIHLNPMSLGSTELIYLGLYKDRWSISSTVKHFLWLWHVFFSFYCGLNLIFYVRHHVLHWVLKPFPKSNSSTSQAFSRCIFKLFQHLMAVVIILNSIRLSPTYIISSINIQWDSDLLY